MYKTVFWKLLLLMSAFALPVLAQEAEQGAYPAPVKGAADPAVTLEVFVDYSCPACVNLNGNIKQIERHFPNDLRVTYRHFPLSAAGHEQSETAARAVEAAGLQGKFWEMSDLILEKQKVWAVKRSAKAYFIAYAKILGLNVERFKGDLENIIVLQRIDADKKRGAFLKINATPSAFVNGKQLSVSEFWTPDELESVIKENISNK
jgi:protein-disulfide isomerase